MSVSRWLAKISFTSRTIERFLIYSISGESSIDLWILHRLNSFSSYEKDVRPDYQLVIVPFLPHTTYVPPLTGRIEDVLCWIDGEFNKCPCWAPRLQFARSSHLAFLITCGTYRVTHFPCCPRLLSPRKTMTLTLLSPVYGLRRFAADAQCVAFSTLRFA